MVRWFRNNKLVGLNKLNYMIVGIIISFTLAGIISIFWVRGIDYMKKNYPDYKGEDFLNWDKDEEDENNIY
jgi:hypothetical protein